MKEIKELKKLKKLKKWVEKRITLEHDSHYVAHEAGTCTSYDVVTHGGYMAAYNAVLEQIERLL